MSPALPREERDAIRAEAASLTEGPEFESSLHIGGMEQDLARFVLDRVPALLDALDAAEAALAALRKWVGLAADDADDEEEETHG